MRQTGQVAGMVALMTLLGAGTSWGQGSTGPSGVNVGQGAGGGPTARECARGDSTRFSEEELQIMCEERGYIVPETDEDR